MVVLISFFFLTYRQSLLGWEKWDLKLEMRLTLFDWLLDVATQEEMNLSYNCLLLSFSVIDAFIGKTQNFSKRQLHILGIAALFIAAKLYHDEFPEATTFTYYINDVYQVADLLAMEKAVLHELGGDRCTSPTIPLGWSYEPGLFFCPSMETNIDSILDFTVFHPLKPSPIVDGEEIECIRKGPYNRGSKKLFLFNYLRDLCLLGKQKQGGTWCLRQSVTAPTDYRMQQFSILEIRDICIKICDGCKMVDEQTALLLQVLQDEKERKEKGKKTAIYRKYVQRHKSGTNWLNALFAEGAASIASTANTYGVRHQHLEMKKPPRQQLKKRKKSVNCAALTKQGKQCKLPAGVGGKFCWKHHYDEV